jgi:hypothetical protein
MSFAAKLAPLHKVVFSAFQLNEPDAKLNPGKAWHVGDFDTLEDAQARAAVRHKQSIMIRERNSYTKETVLRFYRVKQSSKQMVYRAALDGGKHVKTGALYLEHLFDLDTSSLLRDWEDC